MFREFPNCTITFFFEEQALSIFIFSSFVRTDDICCHVMFVERC